LRHYKPLKLSQKASHRRAAPFARWLVIMVKTPVAGRAKTRLAREVGVGAAMRFSRHSAAATIRLATQPFWRTILAITPDASANWPTWPRRLARRPQGGGDLGRRMQRPMLELPPGPVCVIGTDIPGMRVADVRRAFALLGQNDVVFGPTDDGGFWLVGMRRRPRVPEPHARVRFSSPHALEDTMRNLSAFSIGFTARRCDVDTAADLARAGCSVRHIRALGTCAPS
jgi:rSAM/selenodomain-associated transferase 1